jgi:hypothetical protein
MNHWGGGALAYLLGNTACLWAPTAFAKKPTGGFYAYLGSDFFGCGLDRRIARTGIAGAATQIAWILFVVFMVLFVVSLIAGRRPSAV